MADNLKFIELLLWYTEFPSKQNLWPRKMSIIPAPSLPTTRISLITAAHKRISGMEFSANKICQRSNVGTKLSGG